MRLIASLVLAGAAVFAVTAEGSAQTRRHVVTRRVARVYSSSTIQSLPLTVNRRSWLDPGPVAPVGSGPAYVQANTILSKTQDQIFAPDRFGNEVLQGQPYVPGRTVPVVEFSTTPNGRFVVNNVIGPQNYYFNPAPSRFAPSPSPYQNTDDPSLLPPPAP